jgi:hypothetical protein
MNELHYQRRPMASTPWPADTVLEAQGNLVQNPLLASDAEGGLHMAFEAAHSEVTQICYRSWRRERGWDGRSTEVTFTQDGGATRPQLLPTAGGNVDVLYLASAGSRLRLMLRRRQLSGSSPLAVPLGVGGGRLGLWVGPNPLRKGAPLEIAWSGTAGSPSPIVEFFDLSGRRLTSLALRSDGAKWHGRLEPAVFQDWSSGVYFARMRSSATGAARIVFLH